MPNCHLGREPASSACQLQEAPGICSGNDRSAGFGDMTQLSRLQLCGHLRLGDIVDACAAAAPGRFCQLNKLETWDGP